MPNIAQTQLITLQNALAPYKGVLSISIDDETRQILLTEINTNNFKSLTLPARIGAVIDMAKSLVDEGKEPLLYHLDDKIFSPEMQTLSVKEKKEMLTQKEVEILLCLIDGGKKGQSKNYLMEHVWGQRADLDTHTIETHIYRLRQKLEQDPNEPKILLTTNGGYQLIFYKD